MKRICILVSGNGTNCENIIRYFQQNGKAETALVISNRSDAYALVRAKRLGVKTCVMTRQEFNDREKVLAVMEREHIDFIVLAGFLLLIPDFLIDAFDHRIINIHPALLPKFGGKGMYGHHVHEAVKAARRDRDGDDSPLGEPRIRCRRDNSTIQNGNISGRQCRRYCRKGA